MNFWVALFVVLTATGLSLSFWVKTFPYSGLLTIAGGVGFIVATLYKKAGSWQGVWAWLVGTNTFTRKSARGRQEEITTYNISGIVTALIVLFTFFMPLFQKLFPAWGGIVLGLFLAVFYFSVRRSKDDTADKIARALAWGVILESLAVLLLFAVRSVYTGYVWQHVATATVVALALGGIGWLFFREQTPDRMRWKVGVTFAASACAILICVIGDFASIYDANIRQAIDQHDLSLIFTPSPKKLARQAEEAALEVQKAQVRAEDARRAREEQERLKVLAETEKLQAEARAATAVEAMRSQAQLSQESAPNIRQLAPQSLQPAPPAQGSPSQPAQSSLEDDLKLLRPFFNDMANELEDASRRQVEKVRQSRGQWAPNQ